MEKIILFYKFVPIADPLTTQSWQRILCQQLKLSGRIIVSTQGINGTLGGSMASLKLYKRHMSEHPSFKKITYKWSEGSTQDFPRLSVKVRDEIVAFKAEDEIKVNQDGILNGGKHLKPRQLHELIAEKGNEVVFFDGRNAYEAQIGKFKNAIVPNVSRTRNFATELSDPKYDSIKNKPVVTYCTGGIRCEVISAMMKNRGFEEVYQIDGGIIKYGEVYGDEGLWEGKLYVFDKRMVVPFSDKAIDIGICTRCQAKTSNFENCANKLCNDLILLCSTCAETSAYCEQQECLILRNKGVQNVLVN